MSEKKNQLIDDKHVSRNKLTDEILKNGFKKRFKDLTEDLEVRQDLAKHLEVSDQAIGQYRDGSTFPKTSNLIKIAEFFGCSLDYLIGQSDVFSPSADVQAICKYTGLSDSAVNLLHLITTSDYEESSRTLNFINLVLSDPSNIPKSDEFYIKTLFSYMDQYVHSDNVELSVRYGPENISKLVSVCLGDEVTEVLKLGFLYKEMKMTVIRQGLDYYKELLNEQSK
ncbi:MAG: helix-turn-helix domain-containing protein [Oscillospiraceae bacterium]|nr:helix-turn-helix domain-containing protein [Oscillospiraceae bacterium]